MSNYEQLVEDLRLVGKEQDCNECEAGKWNRDINCCLFKDAAAAIEELQAQLPKLGKWIDDEFGAKCSYCGKYAYWSKYEIPWKSPYCPICGAKMEVQDDKA